MLDYEYELAKALQPKLKKIIRGKIFVSVQNDILSVEIANPYGNRWNYAIRNFAHEVLEGNFNTDRIASDIVYRYRKYMTDNVTRDLFYLD